MWGSASGLNHDRQKASFLSSLLPLPRNKQLNVPSTRAVLLPSSVFSKPRNVQGRGSETVLHSSLHREQDIWMLEL